MKSLFLSLLLIAGACQICPSQGQSAEIISVAKFSEPNNYRLLDSLTPPSLDKYIIEEKTLTIAKTKQLRILLNQVQANGTEDVSKCFTPRHAVIYRAAGVIKKYVLICFECDGVRFSNKKSTPVKSDEKRTKQMKLLAYYFSH